MPVWLQHSVTARAHSSEDLPRACSLDLCSDGIRVSRECEACGGAVRTRDQYQRCRELSPLRINLVY